MDGGGGFKVPTAALGRRKKASEKIRDLTEERISKAMQNSDEMTPEIGGNDEVSAGEGALFAGSDRHGQNNEANSLDRGATAAEPQGGVKDEIKDDQTSHDATAQLENIDNVVREGAPSSECDNESSDSGKERNSDKQSHDLSSQQQPVKSAESASSIGDKGPVPPPQMPYTVPHWSGEPPRDHTFSLTVIKNGTIIDEVGLNGKAFVVFGRLPNCDIQLEHPSISRYHAVLQYRPVSQETDSSNEEGEGKEREGETKSRSVFSTNPHDPGYYVYDLGSTHGTYLNKSRLDQRCYYRVRVGQMIKFGGSSRLFLLEVNSTVCSLSKKYILDKNRI